MSKRSAVENERLGRFVEPKVLARISNLNLLARSVVQGFISGLHRSTYLGRSVDFAEHRAYMPGDDIRQIDWRLFARTDRFYVKEFEADTNTSLTLLLDVSRSMNFGSQGITKLDYARFLAASLAVFSQKQRDRIGLVTFDEDILDFVPPSAKHLEIVLHVIDRLKSVGASNYAKPLVKAAEAIHRRGIVVLISDLYDEPESILDSVKGLRYKGNDLIVFHVLDPAELSFPYDDAANYRDIESGEAVPIIPDYLREEYRRLVREHVSRLTRTLGDNRIDYSLFDSSVPLDYALFHYLATRERLTRTR
ncbi:MAG TPA: DUF58 domain-containing protein [Vicinamibacteria bacterium]|nr:DUF58 domain-containing protein [Vicinamibacteria bacterium]